MTINKCKCGNEFVNGYKVGKKLICANCYEDLRRMQCRTAHHWSDEACRSRYRKHKYGR